MPELSCQTEPIAGLWPELLPLADAHWQEVNPDAGMANIDCARYQAAEEAGAFAIMTMRLVKGEESQLVGYASFWISANPQQKQTRQATQDALYLRPDWRRGRIGRLLLSHAERWLKSNGITTVYQSVRRANNFGPLLIACGYEPIETTYEKRI